MPYEYGSQQVDIPNPFRFEGTVDDKLIGSSGPGGPSGGQDH